MIAEQVLARKTTFRKPKSAMKARGTFDQMKVSERRTETKKTESRYFLQSIRNLVSSI